MIIKYRTSSSEPVTVDFDAEARDVDGWCSVLQDVEIDDDDGHGPWTPAKIERRWVIVRGSDAVAPSAWLELIARRPCDVCSAPVAGSEMWCRQCEVGLEMDETGQR